MRKIKILMSVKNKGIRYLKDIYNVISHPINAIVNNSLIHKTLTQNYQTTKKDLEQSIEARKSLTNLVSRLEEDLRKNLEDNPLYKQILKEKKEYQKQAEDRYKLIEHLKNDKKGLMRLVNQVLDKTPDALINFLQEDAYFSKQPLLFVNSRGIIIGSTEALKKKLKIDYDLTGKNCYEILKERYPALKTDSGLKNFFNTYNARDFNTTFKDGQNEINLHILKEEPVLLKNLDLTGIGRSKAINPIAFIPVLVYPIGVFKNFIGKSKKLDKLVTKHKEVCYQLITEHQWTTEDILEKERSLGFDYLVEQCNTLNTIKRSKEKNQKRKV